MPHFPIAQTLVQYEVHRKLGVLILIRLTGAGFDDDAGGFSAVK